MKTILVIRSSAMGDVAITVPVLKQFRRQYPDVKIVMLTPQFLAPFFDDIDHLQVVDIALNGRHAGLIGLWRLYRELRNGHHFDQVIDLHDKIYSKLLRKFFRLWGTPTYHIEKGRTDKKRLTDHRSKQMVQLPSTIDRYADTFARAGYPLQLSHRLEKIARPIPELFAPKEAVWIGLAPFAKHQGKMLPIETIEKLIQKIAIEKPRIRFFIFGGGATEAAQGARLEELYPNTASAVGRLKLREEIDLMANLDVMISMDSSAMHICSIVGTQVISVWGATHHYAGFLGYGQSTEQIVGIDDLDCRPCSVYGNKPCMKGTYECLHRITEEMIAAKF